MQATTAQPVVWFFTLITLIARARVGKGFIMDFKDITAEQTMAAMKAGSREEIKPYLAEQGIELPAKAPWTVHFTEKNVKDNAMKLWNKAMIEPRVLCADDEHDFQREGSAEMERTAATGTGSSFRYALKCTKCGAVKWISEMPVEA
jgi:hypothetical protein